jgi:8-amino-7-oxononanoate synthase
MSDLINNINTLSQEEKRIFLKELLQKKANELQSCKTSGSIVTTQEAPSNTVKYFAQEHQQFLQKAEASGYLYPEVPVMDGMSGSRIRRDGKELINLAGINILGLQEDQKFIELFCDQVRKYGLSTGGSRLTQGVCRPHLELEQKMSQIFGKEYTLTFGTGALANIGFINAMTATFGFDADVTIDNRNVVFVLDRDCHWSLWNPVSKLKFGSEVFAFKHNDPEDLEQTLRQIKSNKVVVVFETVYSSDGSMAPVAKLLDVCERYGALSYVDDANGFMIYGTQNRPFYEDYQALPKATFIMVSFSKAIGIEGGAISGPTEFVKSCEILSGTSLFTATMQPPTAAMNLAIIEHLQNHPEIMDNYLDRCSRLRATLKDEGFRLNSMPSYVTSIHIGRDEVAEQVRRDLLEMGYCVPVFRYPAVSRGQAIVRLMLNNQHTESNINGFVEALKKVRDRHHF